MKKHKNLMLSALLAIHMVALPPAMATSEIEALPVDDLEAFVEVFGIIKQNYVDHVDDKQLLRDAIRGMIQGLDPHTSFLELKQYNDVIDESEGRFGGLGVQITQKNGELIIISPIEDSPAYDAGLKAGDKIVRIDGVPTKNASTDAAVSKLRGLPGTKITLTILREGANKLLEVSLKRAVIKTSSVKSRLLSGNYAWLRIATFQKNTGESLRAQIKKLKKKSKNNLAGIILDLRNNPGGVLSGAVEVSDVFLDKGLIVSTKGRNETLQSSFSATAGDDVLDLPLVVLVNSGSASASEIVAGALQDHRRGIILGTKTFGKGSVQTITRLNNNNDLALKLTTARYYTPNNRSIQAEGIHPDVVVSQVDIVETSREGGYSVADLLRHLKNENGDSQDSKQRANNVTAPEINDFQIREAVNLLKGMNFAKGLKADG